MQISDIAIIFPQPNNLIMTLGQIILNFCQILKKLSKPIIIIIQPSLIPVCEFGCVNTALPPIFIIVNKISIIDDSFVYLVNFVLIFVYQFQF